MSDSAPAQHADPAMAPADPAIPTPIPTSSSAAPSASAPAPSACLYKPCACLGVLPNRACPSCYSSKWMRRCDKCHGVGFWFKNTSQNHPRQEPCAECNKRGWKPVMPKDREKAAAAYAEWKQQVEAAQMTYVPAGPPAPPPPSSPIRVAAKSTRK